jgi:hypothetical protein
MDDHLADSAYIFCPFSGPVWADVKGVAVNEASWGKIVTIWGFLRGQGTQPRHTAKAYKYIEGPGVQAGRADRALEDERDQGRLAIKISASMVYILHVQDEEQNYDTISYVTRYHQ